MTKEKLVIRLQTWFALAEGADPTWCSLTESRALGEIIRIVMASGEQKKDVPEGVRYIQISETLADKMKESLRGVLMIIDTRDIISTRG